MKINVGDIVQGWRVIAIGIPFAYVGSDKPETVLLLDSTATTGPPSLAIGTADEHGNIADTWDDTAEYGEAWERFADACA